MIYRTLLSASAFLLSFNVGAVTLDEFSESLIESHPYFVQLSLSEKTSLLNQKSLSTFNDWNIKAGANQTYTGALRTAPSGCQRESAKVFHRHSS